jgi:orotate phosphoribosyltransferase
MKEAELEALLRSTGAIVDAHVAIDDRTHSSLLLRTAKATQFAPHNRRIAHRIVRHFLELDVHVVIAANAASIPFAVEIGRQLEARTTFVDTQDSARLAPGFELHDGERVLVVIDILRSNAAYANVSRIVRNANARTIGIGSIIDARIDKPKPIIREITAITLDVPAYPVDGCPLCADSIPLIDS